MVTIAELWLPILLSGVAVFFLSFVFWAMSPHHKAEMQSLGDNEAELMDFIKSRGIKPGQYMFPYCDTKEKDPDEKKAAMEKWNEGCIAHITIFNGAPSMGRNMGCSVLTNLIVASLIAYVAGIAHGPGASFMDIMQLTGAIAFGIYALGDIMGGIWFGRPFRAFVTNWIDAAFYALATGAIFGWLWPGIEAASGGSIPTP